MSIMLLSQALNFPCSARAAAGTGCMPPMFRTRDGAPAVLKSMRNACPWLRRLFADDAYAGPKLRGALDRVGKRSLEIVKRSDNASGFEVIPRRWGVERTFAWLRRRWRLARDCNNPSPPAGLGPPSHTSASQPGTSKGLVIVDRPDPTPVETSHRGLAARRKRPRRPLTAEPEVPGA